MFLFRTISLKDKNAFIDLVHTANAGITSLPKDPFLLEKKLKKSVEDFALFNKSPLDEAYLFVIENILNHSIIGVSGIYSSTGHLFPTHYYSITSEQLEKDGDALSLLPRKLIQIVSVKDGPSELGSLFLHPNSRSKGIGKLLSLSRLLFIACFPERFKSEMIACLRGFIDENSHFPFWEFVGRHFLDISYEELQKRIQQDPSIISKILPKHPIYTTFLPPIVENVLGETHKKTIPAKIMLMQQGFEVTDKIDPFDGGPLLKCNTKNLKTVVDSKTAILHELIEIPKEENLSLICNNHINFRCCMGQVYETQENRVAISKHVASMLHVKLGDTIRYMFL